MTLQAPPKPYTLNPACRYERGEMTLAEALAAALPPRAKAWLDATRTGPLKNGEDEAVGLDGG